MGQLDQATTAIDSANGSVGEAYNYAQQVEADRLFAIVASVVDSLGTARQITGAAKTTAATEQQEAQSWGK